MKQANDEKNRALKKAFLFGEDDFAGEYLKNVTFRVENCMESEFGENSFDVIFWYVTHKHVHQIV